MPVTLDNPQRKSPDKNLSEGRDCPERQMTFTSASLESQTKNAAVHIPPEVICRSLGLVKNRNMHLCSTRGIFLFMGLKQINNLEKFTTHTCISFCSISGFQRLLTKYISNKMTEEFPERSFSFEQCVKYLQTTIYTS